MPLEWAMTQNNLGDALRVLGERKSGTARLKKAVTAFRSPGRADPGAVAARVGHDPEQPG